MYYLLTCLMISLIGSGYCYPQTSLLGQFIFEPDKIKHGHTHASSIVECPDGNLLACWYEGETDKSRDVHIQAARLKMGETTWSGTFLLADTPMLSDNNPCLLVDRHNRLWLFYYTLLGSPEEAWHTALLRYKISSKYQDPAKPITWEVERDLPVIPVELDETIDQICNMMIAQTNGDSAIIKKCDWAREKLESQLSRRLGWTTRARPTILSNGSLLLPMASEIFGIAAMAITANAGNTWIFSKSPLGYGVEQPGVFERTDGGLVAYMRDASPAQRIRMSESRDHGFTWSPVVNTDFPNPGSGVEVFRCARGNIVLIYNDCTEAPRNSLAVSMSNDEGKTWKWTRHLEHTDGPDRFDYPSIIQARDGTLHATYSYDVRTIKHVVFNEAWIKEEW